MYSLIAIAEHGTFSAAAQALHISQPSLSRSIRILETTLGTPLFDRTKNRATLNEAGRIAVAEARRVTQAAEVMEQRMQAYVRSQHTISVGACAPAPLWELVPILSKLYADRTISSEMQEPAVLLDGLRSGVYQVIALDAPVQDPDILCRQFVTEQLYVSLPPTHTLGHKHGLYLSELSGETMLLYTELGVWQRLRNEKMQGIHFISLSQWEAFSDLVDASTLPIFTTNLTRRTYTTHNRIDVPILDPDATLVFYLCAQKREQTMLDKLLTQRPL